MMAKDPTRLVGAGTVYVEGNKDLILDAGTEMVIQQAEGNAEADGLL